MVLRGEAGGLRPGSCRAAGRKWSSPEGKAGRVLDQREVSRGRWTPMCVVLRGQSGDRAEGMVTTMKALGGDGSAHGRTDSEQAGLCI